MPQEPEAKEVEKDNKETKDLKKELEFVQKERDEYLAGWKRAKADLVNFRKETEKSIAELGDIAKMRVIDSVLPVLDSLDESVKNKIEGLEQIRSLFLDILKKQGVTKIETKPGDNFNPEIHEAVDGTGDKIGEVIFEGYKYKDRIIRPTKVKVISK